MENETLRAELEAELATLVRRASKIDAHLKNIDHEPPADWSELAVFRANDEVLEHLDEHTRHRVAELAATLERMTTEDWGVCASCDRAIAAGRMKVLPTTTLCVRCAEAAE